MNLQPHQANIHGDEALKELLLSQETFKDNFMSSLVRLGCVILGTHHKHDVEVKKKIAHCNGLWTPNMQHALNKKTFLCFHTSRQYQSFGDS